MKFKTISLSFLLFTFYNNTITYASCVNEYSICNQDVPKKSLAQSVFEVTMEKGSVAGLEHLENLKDSSTYYLSSNEMNRVAHALYQSQKEEDAMAIFSYNKKAFPELRKSLATMVFMSMHKYGGVAGIRKFNQLKDSEFISLHESEMNIVGYSFLRVEKIKEAVAIFKLNTEAFPHSSNVFDSLAEGYLNDGQKDLAMKNYRKSLSLLSRTSFPKLAAFPIKSYTPTLLPIETTELFYSKGNLEGDTAFIFVQGGPMLEIDYNENNTLSLLPNSENILRIYPKQSAVINPSWVSAPPTLTSKQADFEHQQSVEILDRTINYLKEKGKTVFVIGHSYGAMISLQYLNSKKNQTDKLVLMGMNLEMSLRHQEMTAAKGKIVRWKDGITPYEEDLFGDFPLKVLIQEELTQVLENLSMMVKTHGRKKFTTLLKDKELSNVIFVHALKDESVGRVKPMELDFLKSKGVEIMKTEGDHHSMFSEAFMSELYLKLKR